MLENVYWFSLYVLVQDSFSHFKIQGVCWKRSAIGGLSHSSGAKWISAPRSICFWSLLTGRKIGTVALSCFSRATSPLHLVLRQGRGMNSRGMIPGCAGQKTWGHTICSSFYWCVHVSKGNEPLQHGGQSWAADRLWHRWTSADWFSSSPSSAGKANWTKNAWEKQ